MSTRYPPQSRMPTLGPQKIGALWYPRQGGVEHMNDELLQEEAAYESSLKSISLSGTHFKPIGVSKPFLDDHEDEEEEEEEEEDEEAVEEGGVDRGVDLDAEMDQVDLEPSEVDLDADIMSDNEDFLEQGGDYINNNRYNGPQFGLEVDLDAEFEEVIDYRSDGDDGDNADLYSPVFSPP
ncbi:hypothetical protein BG011_000690 [Mortierella polycephala]|uniref:Uncharacterized protein n=1 Tax=Mortierella polycephala TaxID=41804 RepID=A0A9P6U6I1_9FUNG|nr:hypothetical protein BG011_000690 [Mortierella polycephala]